ncbi:hypothetical protein B0T21DRAFT_24124 [Apiosordaria backusii]|uniref:Uncharacterized protein n=1 Tax=Apiosordaria backusii TaxID=314023 RepID=A0AA40EZR8_9PEZI|nr:hypothetical protein B0T21DRAFT_24124 [Apiosordaria backusii]
MFFVAQKIVMSALFVFCQVLCVFLIIDDLFCLYTGGMVCVSSLLLTVVDDLCNGFSFASSR